MPRRHPTSHLASRPTTIIDRLMMVTAVLYPLAGVPQAIQIFQTHNAAGVSLLSWITFLVLDIVELLYGSIHRLKPLILTAILWIIVDVVVMTGIFLYR